jgi:hypothetical protein
MKRKITGLKQFYKTEQERKAKERQLLQRLKKGTLRPGTKKGTIEFKPKGF